MGSSRVGGEGRVERIAHLGCAGCSREGNVPGWFCLYECIAFSTIVFSGYGMNL
jgi:hypothetical protein